MVHRKFQFSWRSTDLSPKKCLEAIFWKLPLFTEVFWLWYSKLTRIGYMGWKNNSLSSFMFLFQLNSFISYKITNKSPEAIFGHFSVKIDLGRARFIFVKQPWDRRIKAQKIKQSLCCQYLWGGHLLREKTFKGRLCFLRKNLLNITSLTFIHALILTSLS